MLIVYKAKAAVCQQAAETMQPLDEPETERWRKAVTLVIGNRFIR